MLSFAGESAPTLCGLAYVLIHACYLFVLFVLFACLPACCSLFVCLSLCPSVVMVVVVVSVVRVGSVVSVVNVICY